jgi:predicted Zn-dependent peptidase
MYDIFHIDGITFIYSCLKEIETASLGVFVRVGSRFEKKPLRGISHFLEHMLFKGSRKYSYKKIKQEIEGRGGVLNGYTSEEFSAYYAHFLNKNLENVLDILLSMVNEPLFKEEDIEKERRVILEEIKMYNDLPSSRAEAFLSKLLWPGHPLGEDIIGEFSTVKQITRKNLFDFQNSYYKPSNMIIAFSGNYPQNRISRLLEKYKYKESPLSAASSITSPAELEGIHIKTEHKQLQQSYLCAGFRGISYLSKQRVTIELINVILGANMSSRLFEELREKRALCYDISSGTAKYKDSGSFVIKLGLDKNKIETALKAILKELNKFKNKKVPAKELSRAKDYLLGQTAMGLEQPQGRMFYLAQCYLTLGKIYSFAEIKEEVQSITSKDISDLAKSIFQFKNMCISCVGNFGPGQEQRIKETLRKGGYYS